MEIPAVVTTGGGAGYSKAAVAAALIGVIERKFKLHGLSKWQVASDRPIASCPSAIAGAHQNFVG